jgi:hypothetical protein
MHISGASFLADGRLALSMAFAGHAGNPDGPMGAEAWVLDATSGTVVPFIAKGSNPRAAIVSVSPDGTNLAYVQLQEAATRTGCDAPPAVRGLVAGSDGSPAVKVFAVSRGERQPYVRLGDDKRGRRGARRGLDAGRPSPARYGPPRRFCWRIPCGAEIAPAGSRQLESSDDNRWRCGVGSPDGVSENLAIATIMYL